jgi:hypothetical protein
MRIRSTSALLSLVMIFCYGASARGQSAQWTDRGYVNVSGWFQPSSSLSNTVRPLDFAEPSEIDNRYQTGGVPGFEADGGIRIWRNLAVGAASYASRKRPRPPFPRRFRTRSFSTNRERFRVTPPASHAMKRPCTCKRSGWWRSRGGGSLRCPVALRGSRSDRISSAT